MAHELNSFLNKYSIKDNTKSTHVSLKGGKYNIPFEEKGELIELLSKYAFKEKICLAESPPINNITQIKIDLDFKYTTNTGQRHHDMAFKRDFIELYNDIIRKYLVVKDSELKAFVFEREKPYNKNGFDKDGIHIIYPYIFCSTKLQLKMRTDALKICASLLNKLQCSTAVSEIIDKGIIETAPWLMYGCSKKDTDPYKLSNIIDSDLSDLSTKNYTLKNLIELLSTRDHDETKLCLRVHIEEEEEHEENVIIKNNNINNNYNYNSNNSKKSLITDDNNLEEIKKLVDILSTERSDNYAEWINVGLCLRHISNNLLDDWLLFSKKSDKYDENVAINVWNKFNDGTLGVGSLHVWAKEDNNIEYENIMSESLRNYINRSKSKCSQDIASVIHKMYQYDYKYAPQKKGGSWYEFYDHRWHKCEGAVSLMKRIGSNVLNEYIKASLYYQRNALIVDDEKKIEYLKNSEILTQITYSLRDFALKEKFIKECAIMFSDTEIESKFDSNPDLLCFNNGVYDLKDQYFRKGTPDDNLFLCTNIDYIEYDNDHEYIIGIYNFISQVFPEKEKRDYTMLMLSTMLEGRNPQEQFYLLSGTGGNGKSKLNELMEKCLGGYAAKVPTSLFTQKTGASSSANPEIARLRGIRLISAQETDEKEAFNIATVKNMTGNDRMIARELFGNFFEFYPQFKVLFSCNHRPTFPPDDEAVWRRVINILFNSRFVENPDSRNKFEFKRDNYLADKLELWKEAFMFILIDNYKLYKKAGKLFVPQCIIDDTVDYKKSNDFIGDFITEKIVQEEGECIKLDDTYNVFKTWWKSSIDHKPMTKVSFKDGMVKRFGPYVCKTGWINKKLLRDTDEQIAVSTIVMQSEDIKAL